MQQPTHTQHYDLIIIGAGILGTFHAYHALNQGLSVALIEKNKAPRGASTQNFGQVVPSGMNLKWQTLGRTSLEIYKSLQEKIDISLRNNGSVYIASNDEELQLIEELAAINKSNGYTSELLTKDVCLERWPGLKYSYCKAGLFFPEEITLNARLAVHRILGYLQEQMGLHYFSNRMIIDVEVNANACKVVDTLGNKIYSNQVIICNGSDFRALFPNVFWESDLEVTKLHMLQTNPQPTQRIPGNILTGNTIRRYESFTECPSYAGIKAKEDKNSYARKYGIHILFKQKPDGAVIIGDSHEYADAKDQDDLGYDLNNQINRYMMDEAMKIFELQTFKIDQAWYGMYSQCKTQDIFQYTIEEKIHIVTGIGGKGMTGSPAFAKHSIQQILQKEVRTVI